MLKAINFIKHAISKKGIDERLAAVHCMGSRVQAYNGNITMEHPCPELGVFSVNSDKLIRAVQGCNSKMTVRLTEKMVHLEDGTMKVSLPYTPEFVPIERQKGKKKRVPANLLEKLKLVQPFISEDASRSWSTSVRCSKGYLYATNNIVIARTKLDMPDATIPVELIEVLLKLKELPKRMTMSESSVTFHYKGKAWLQGSLIIEKWPEFMELFDKRKKTKPLPENLLEVINKLKYFTDEDNITFKDNKAITEQAMHSNVDLPDIKVSCTHLIKVLEGFTHGNFKSQLISLDGNDIEGVMASRI